MEECADGERVNLHVLRIDSRHNLTYARFCRSRSLVDKWLLDMILLDSCKMDAGMTIWTRWSRISVAYRLRVAANYQFIGDSSSCVRGTSLGCCSYCIPSRVMKKRNTRSVSEGIHNTGRQPQRAPGGVTTGLVREEIVGSDSRSRLHA